MARMRFWKLAPLATVGWIGLAVTAGGAAADSQSQCIALGDDLLNTTGEEATLAAANKIMRECDTAGLLALAEHYNELGRTEMALATVSGCIEKAQTEFYCWVQKAALHIKLRQVGEAEAAANQAMALAGDDSTRQRAARDVVNLVERAKQLLVR